MLTVACIWLAFVGGLSGASTDRGEQQAPQKKEAEKRNATVSMTGCVDEQDGKYLLIDERTRDPIASLEADGFETEGFAKHVGHKVTIRGTSSTGGARPLFRVRSIETINESCGTV